MTKNELAGKNPLKVFAIAADGSQVDRRMGLVISRAGLGKTALLVQIALDSILSGRQVLHVSINQSLDKTRVWYEDIIKDVAGDDAAGIMDQVNRNRLIMTFKEASFTRPKLEERLNDLVYQNIFRPTVVLVDGFTFDDSSAQSLADLKELAGVMGLNIWFTAVSHREDERKSAAGTPAPCHEVDDIFDTVLLIEADGVGGELALNAIKDTIGSVSPGKVLKLDPATYLVKGT